MNNLDIKGAKTKSIINRTSNEQNIASNVHIVFLVFILVDIFLAANPSFTGLIIRMMTEIKLNNPMIYPGIALIVVT